MWGSQTKGERERWGGGVGGGEWFDGWMALILACSDMWEARPG